jgi:hypothetical protein
LTDSEITIGDSSQVTIPGTTIVTIEGALVLEEGGVEVGRLDAKYDFADLDPRHHHIALQMISKCHRLMMQTPEDRAESKRVWDEYETAKEARAALPWHKRLFAPYPRLA